MTVKIVEMINAEVYPVQFLDKMHLVRDLQRLYIRQTTPAEAYNSDQDIKTNDKWSIVENLTISFVLLAQ